KELIVAALLWAALGPVAAQLPDNRRTKRIPVAQVWQLDTLTLAPPLLSVRDAASGRPLPLHFFGIKNTLLMTDTVALRAYCPECERLEVRYRTLPFDLGASTSRMDTMQIARVRMGGDNINFDYRPWQPQSKPWESGGLQTNGAYTRGLSLGNNQNLVFNSNLNLQLSGRIGKDIEIAGAISDNSIPLQPDGTTRQLQEFDRIFIQLRRRSAVLTAGDYDLNRPQGYFANYFKRLQGVAFRDEKIAGRDTFEYSVAAALSRGRFARQLIEGREGNQGPYRLQGADGERFIIVLAGTERVFADGLLLRRGQEDDYVMDYNTGELTFTARRLITKDIRIIVEFEYITRQYTRSTIQTGMRWRRTRGEVYANIYAEQDGRAESGVEGVGDAGRRVLALAGDNLRNAFSSGVDTLQPGDAPDPARVYYVWADTMACGQPIRFLRQTANLSEAQVSARFTETPQGQGNYRLLANGANGRAFEWVAPDPVNCAPRGNFEPVVRLNPPELRHLYTAGARFRPDTRTAILAEAALSNRDINRLSPLDADDNLGFAGYLEARRELRAGSAHGWHSQVRVAYEHTGRHFLPLNPYRAPEFVRDWNTDVQSDTVAEHLLRAGVAAALDKKGDADYELGAFIRQGSYRGIRHKARVNASWKDFTLRAEWNALSSSGVLEDSRFSRPKFEIAKVFFKNDSTQRRAWLQAGYYFERERNQRSRPNEPIGPNELSFWYDMMRCYVGSPARNEGLQWELFYRQRTDYLPRDFAFVQSALADEFGGSGAWRPMPAPSRRLAHTLNYSLTLRRLHTLIPNPQTEVGRQNTWLGRADYTLSAWRNAVNLTLGYELGSGQSPRIEFTYIRVSPGEGQYVWIDRNLDSLIQQDEMEIAVFRDQANFVRVAATSPEYIRTNNALFNQNLRLEPRVIWSGSKKRWKKALSRASLQNTLQVNRRVRAGVEGVSVWNPFQLTVSDTALASAAISVRSVFFFNRGDPRWDASIARNDNRNRQLLATGFEKRSLGEWALHARYNLNKHWSVEQDYATGERGSDNELFAARRFDIAFANYQPQINWLPNRHLRLSLWHRYRSSQNRLGDEISRQNDWTAELAWNPAARQATSVRSRVALARVRYNGEANTPVSYSMLEGLQNGQNALWSLQLDRQLSGALQISLQYEGRKTGDIRVIHSGNAQVRALF
ncbi:MAG: hypothetical protein ACK4NS_01115, partial [Saprospiraceae bacterium]